ncbi:MAG: hypothetical protein H6546_07540 [Chitinophagales bacterium]|nr:hypothetical protein [Chitinophagales bacterium]MCP5415066.1 hypothetical protein [Chromatiaceae bacterium]
MPEYYETTDDYRIKYGHCFALATDLDEKYASVVQFQDHFNKGSGNKIIEAHVSMFYRTLKNQTRREESMLSMNSISLKPLMMGAVNLNKSVVFMTSKKPDGNTKYRKLPCEGNFRMIDPFVKEREYLDLRPVGVVADYFILNAWGNRVFYSATDALNSVMEHRRLGAAFTPGYFFGISLAGDGIFLYKNGKRVARVNTNGEIVLKPVVHWLSEQLSEFGLNVKKVTK